MNIPRPQLVQAFAAFEAHGNGVVIGAPGAGKTHLLKKYFLGLAPSRPKFLLPLDLHGVESDSELRESLNVEDDLLDVLDDWKEATVATPGLFLIDSYDSLRSEKTQKYFRGLITRARNRLHNRWRIVVSVRTYDALHSASLLDLFPRRSLAPQPEFQLPGVHCSHFFVPPLLDEEVREALASIPALGALYESGADDLRELLRNPFNIWLAEQLQLGQGDATLDLRSVSSEVELLSLFWKRRVHASEAGLRRENVLSKVATAMVDQKRLSILRDPIYRPEDDAAWTELLSLNVLAEPKSMSARVSFAHAILFDFAVSVLLLEDDAEFVASFLSQELARPVFLRPSLDYYFTRLWYETRPVFWDVFWHLLASTDANLRLFGRLLPVAVVVRETRVLADLGPLFAAVQTRRRNWNDAITALLQAREAVGHRDVALWARVLERLVDNIDKSFAWDLTVQAFRIQTDDKPTVEVLGRIGRAVLEWAWGSRSSSKWHEALASSWAIRLVLRTYATDAPASRRLLQPIVDASVQGALPVDYLRNITDDMRSIWLCDAAFAGSILERVFEYEEKSEEKTNLGSSPILQFSSNRAQDYRMCVYKLVHSYPEFLEKEPSIALASGIRAVDKFILRCHIQPYMRSGHSVEELVSSFDFAGKRAIYLTDSSHVWGVSTQHDQEIGVAAEIFRSVTTAAQRGAHADIDRTLDAFVKHARSAYWWKRLLEIGAKDPKVFAERLFPLCLAQPVIFKTPTLKAAADFVAACYPYWTTNERERVETAIWEAAAPAVPEETVLQHRRRFIGLLEPARLVTSDAIALRTKMLEEGIVEENRPLFWMETGGRTLGPDDWAREGGANPDTPANRVLLDASAPLRDFGTRWLNEQPPPADAASALVLLTQCREVLARGEAAESVLAIARSAIATVAAILARTMSADDPGFALVRDILIEGASAIDATAAARHDDLDFPSWSSTPETEAAQGLPWIALRKPDEQVLDAIERLANHYDAVVRYLLISQLFRISGVAPARFWAIVERRTAVDRAPVVLLAICQTIQRVGSTDLPKTVQIVRHLWSVLPSVQAGRQDFRDHLVGLMVGLALEHSDAWALEEVRTVLNAPTKHSDTIGAFVHQLWEEIVPRKLGGRTFGKALSLVTEGIQATCSALLIPVETSSPLDTNVLSRLHHVIEHSVMQVFFAMEGRAGRGSQGASNAEPYFGEVKHVLRIVIDFGLKSGFISASTVHHLMETLNVVVAFDARTAILLASGAAIAGEHSGYSVDALAIAEVVRLVERVLADHRDQLQDAEVLEALVRLLDVFARTGWPEAIRLVWRLDEIFR